MIYPIKIQQKLEEVEAIINRWDVNVNFNDVLQWIMQFDNDDFDLAIRIIKNLNVIGFNELNKALTIAYSKLERKAKDIGAKINPTNTIFAGIGEAGKSGSMISYNFRLSNNISEENFIIDENTIKLLERGEVKNVVLIDDIVATGTSVIEEVRKLTERTIPFEVDNIFVLTAVGMKEGIEKVRKEFNDKINIFSAFQYDIHDTITSLDSKFYDDIPFHERVKAKEQLEYYGKSISRNHFGFGGIGGLIVFYYNTPNTTIPVVWGSTNSWIPLFKRATRLSGISSHYAQFDKALEKKVRERKEQRVVIENELTIYVEGNLDEYFFEIISDDIKKALSVEKINVISLGGFGSEKLIANLAKTVSSKYIFIPEEQIDARNSDDKIEKYLKGKYHTYMKSIFYYVDVESFVREEVIIRIPDKEELEKLSINQLIKEIEYKTIRRAHPAIRQKVLKAIFDRYQNKAAISELINSIKSVLSKEVQAQTNDADNA